MKKKYEYQYQMLSDIHIDIYSHDFQDHMKKIYEDQYDIWFHIHLDTENEFFFINIKIDLIFDILKC